MDEPDSHADELHEAFLRHFTTEQFRILAYVRSLIYDQTAAHDVFQEISLAIWRNYATFDTEMAFGPWALGIARNQVLKYWRSQRRDRHVFSDNVLESLANEALSLTPEMPARQKALEDCVKQLSDRQRDLIEKFYGENQSAAVMAKQWDRSVHAVYKTLKVMRRTLFDCIERTLAEEK